MAEENAPSSVRLPEAVVPFRADMTEVERAMEELKDRVLKELPEAFGQAFATLDEKIDALSVRLSESAKPLSDALAEAAKKADEVASGAERGGTRIGVAGLEGRKPDEGIKVEELIERFGVARDRMSDFLGADNEIKQEMQEQTSLLREIKELLATAQEGD